MTTPIPQIVLEAVEEVCGVPPDKLLTGGRNDYCVERLIVSEILYELYYWSLQNACIATRSDWNSKYLRSEWGRDARLAEARDLYERVSAGVSRKRRKALMNHQIRGAHETA